MGRQTKISTQQRLVRALLHQTVVSLARVALNELDYSGGLIDESVLKDTLVFTLLDGRRFELLVEQAHVLFEEIHSGQPSVPARQNTTSIADSNPSDGSIAEEATKAVWTRDGVTKFLVLASYELSDGQDRKALSVQLDMHQLGLPWTVDSITEVWTGSDNAAFLVAIVLWSRARHPLLALYLTADEADIFSIDDLHRRLDRVTFSTGKTIHFWYDQ